MNIVFYALVALAVAAGAWGSAVEGTDAMSAVSKGALDGARSSIDLSLSLGGSLALFLGLLKVVERGGGMDAVARALRPLLVRLFPDVPADHPAMGAMTLNLAANVLGLGNAATPFGVRAMVELEKLNPQPGVATNAMVLFLAINTSGITVIPRDALALRQAAHSADPAAIFATTLLASALNTVVAVGTAKLFQGRSAPTAPTPLPWTAWIPFLFALSAVAALIGTVYAVDAASAWIVPGLILGMLTFGLVRGVRVYEAFVEGAREGLETALRIVPYLVAILSVVGMFRASGAMDRLVAMVAPVASLVGIPAEVLPLAFLRPLSGSASVGLATEISQTYGPDTFVGQVAGTMLGTTETTFYVLAVYFGAVKVSRYRHAVWTGVCSDAAGVLASVLAVRLLLG